METRLASRFRVTDASCTVFWWALLHNCHQFLVYLSLRDPSQYRRHTASHFAGRGVATVCDDCVHGTGAGRRGRFSWPLRVSHPAASVSDCCSRHPPLDLLLNRPSSKIRFSDTLMTRHSTSSSSPDETRRLRSTLKEKKRNIEINDAFEKLQKYGIC